LLFLPVDMFGVPLNFECDISSSMVCKLSHLTHFSYLVTLHTRFPTMSQSTYCTGDTRFDLRHLQAFIYTVYSQTLCDNIGSNCTQ
jgi:hypothetical protein